MVFSSFEFLFAFLPLTLLVYWAVPTSSKNAALLGLSLLFFTWGGGAHLFLLLFSIGANYLFGMLAGREALSERGRRLCVVGSIACNVGLLATFKYGNFAIAQINPMLHALGLAPIAWAERALPIGISFFTFQAMSYVFDVSRRDEHPVRNPIDFALYIAMFPQLIAGPIVRFKEIAPQLRRRTTTASDVARGARRFFFGLAKKVIVADSVAAIADAAFGAPGHELSTASAWVGLVAYTLQIYFDFSGYSDMAIGMGHMFGFRLPENFDRPYSARSVTEFWRRWHITLSNWFRDYLYLPLGGSRRGLGRTYLNLTTVFLLCGLWHGAAWNFVLWGAFHGALLIVERATGWRQAQGRLAARRVTTLVLVMLGWVLFRANDLSHAVTYFAALFGGGGSQAPVELGLALSTRNVVVLIAASLTVLFPNHWRGGPLVEAAAGRAGSLATAVLLCIVVPYTTLLILSGTYSPFLYFQF